MATLDATNQKMGRGTARPDAASQRRCAHRSTVGWLKLRQRG
ncbi:hypothetical protein [Cobetia marina]|nr:hypothetical protein [Cobetia marina]